MIQTGKRVISDNGPEDHNLSFRDMEEIQGASVWLETGTKPWCCPKTLERLPDPSSQGETNLLPCPPSTHLTLQRTSSNSVITWHRCSGVGPCPSGTELSHKNHRSISHPSSWSRFKLKVGEDYTNIGIQVNPIFNHEGKTKVICYNYMDKSWWGEEEKTTNFPFVPGSRVEISITFNGFGFTAILPKDVQIHVPNRLKLNAATFLQTTGDFKVRKVTFD
ncbi:beta-galactoside-binding lectin-like isoform X1 [Sminthopsis crassicaudata]|uniref:beta-galactoside-binding lectin-like isoform X1 n=1 Tax=Sminthopsis crassicaudata TaxID=9301 RepID=UPI003D69468F